MEDNLSLGLEHFSNNDNLNKSFDTDNDLQKGKRVPIGTVTGGYKKVAEGKWEAVKKESSKKGSTEGKGITGGKVSDEAAQAIFDANKDSQTRVSMRKYLTGDSHRFEVKTSQFGSNRLIVTNNETGKVSYAGADSKLADKLVDLGVPHTGKE